MRTSQRYFYAAKITFLETQEKTEYYVLTDNEKKALAYARELAKDYPPFLGLLYRRDRMDMPRYVECNGIVI